jgi:hypothetical protein
MTEPAGAGRRRPFAQSIACDQQLGEDLAGVQIAHEGHRPRMAERAGQAAAHLGRDAHRAAIGFGNVDRLHLAAVAEAQQPFARAIGGFLVVDDGRSRAAIARRKAFAQPLRQ